jgi:hypothetical protein
VLGKGNQQRTVLGQSNEIAIQAERAAVVR